MSEEFLSTNWRCLTIYNKRLFIRIILDKIRLLLPSSTSSCSSPACTSKMTNDSTLITSFSERWTMLLTRTRIFFFFFFFLGWSPRHQKQAAVKVSELRFSGVVFFVKFTCSCWVPQAFFINWFANVVAS